MAKNKKLEKKEKDENLDKQLLAEAKNYKEDKEKERKQDQATRELILGRKKQLMSIPVPVDEDDDTIKEITFKARRLTQKEISNFRSFNMTENDILNLPEDERDEIAKEGYEILSLVIEEPKLSAEEWEEVDLALVQDLIAKAGILQRVPNDGQVIKMFKDFSIGLMMQNWTT